DGSGMFVPGWQLFGAAGHFVNGLTTVIVPLEFNVIDVAPVNRQPAPASVASALDFIDRLLGGIVSGSAYFGSPARANVGLLFEQPEFVRYRFTGVPAPCQLVVTLPLNVGVPQTRIASFECSGPLITSPEEKLMSTQWLSSYGGPPGRPSYQCCAQLD